MSNSAKCQHSNTKRSQQSKSISKNHVKMEPWARSCSPGNFKETEALIWANWALVSLLSPTGTWGCGPHAGVNHLTSLGKCPPHTKHCTTQSWVQRELWGNWISTPVQHKLFVSETKLLFRKISYACSLYFFSHPRETEIRYLLTGLPAAPHPCQVTFYTAARVTLLPTRKKTWVFMSFLCLKNISCPQMPIRFLSPL